MDVDSWASRIHSVKHLSAVQASRHNSDAKAGTEEQNSENEELDDLRRDIYKLQNALEELKAQISTKNLIFQDHHLAIDDSDGDDDKKACFPCPFCYVDVDIQVLCSHLEDEHCFDLKNAVCPLCAANLGKDVTAHFLVQHSSLLKRKKRTQKSGLWVGSSAMLGKELSSFLGPSTNGRANTLESASDLLLSSFLSSVPLSDNNGSRQVESSNKSASTKSHLKSTEISTLGGSNELDNEERRQKAAFVQQLTVSTIL